jgi:hypothetical protein
MNRETGKRNPATAASPSPHELLTESQRRHLQSVLRYIERSLQLAERELATEPSGGILQDLRSDLSARERELLRERISNARGILCTLAERFSLRTDSSDLRRSIVSCLSLLAIDAGSAASDGLRAYGPVRESLPAALDPLIEALARELEAAVASVAGGRQGRRTP